MAFLQVTNLGLSFGGIQACRGLNFEMPQGQLWGLIGPNGAGKTTLFNLLTGIYPPTTGDVQFNGQSIKGLASFQIARLGIGRTFQNIRLFKERSCLENVMAGLYFQQRASLLDVLFDTQAVRQEEAKAKSRAQDLLEFMGIAKWADVPAGGLPYGDQRKLEIARALALEPKLLLLDEPAAGLNPTETHELTGTIQRIYQELGCSVLVIEHDMRLVMTICQHLLVLDHGQLIANNKPELVRDDPKVIQAYLGVDADG